MDKRKLPELLCPAGSPEAFLAAIDGGADAIYVGGASFNARINAKNFSPDELREAVKLAHLYGVKVYQTVNIMLHQRELGEFLESARESMEMGIDAFIISDIGAAALVRRYLPDMPLHASTQMSIHNSSGACLLENYGFSRVVPARELSKGDIYNMVRENPLEIEIFIHGALCVSHSGQCLFSSLVGGRSGNRGLCAQPCRLPYCSAESRTADKYPLSLKDMSLASHVTEIIESNVSSLKIEGRMKSPEYVRGVAKIWRRLLDEGRNATRDELRELSDIFSRGGFTDGYFTEKIDRQMLGVRSENDKQLSREGERFSKISRRVDISMLVSLHKGESSRLTVRLGDKSASVEGDVVQEAINAPIDRATVEKSMLKLGDTPFSCSDLEIDLDENVMLPISRLNALRREGIERLSSLICETKQFRVGDIQFKTPKSKPIRRNTGRFLKAEQITDRAREFFDIILLPLAEYSKTKADGFVMPSVIFDSEEEKVKELLQSAAKKGAEYVVVSNFGQIALVKKHLPAARLIADYRFNIANNESMAFFEELGFESEVLSAELTLPQLRDIKGAKAAIVYGRIPLMTLEKCVIKELYGKNACDICARGGAEMKDRRGFVFPVVREPEHRNIVLNSLPTSMSDRQEELEKAGIVDRHFLFTVESDSMVDCVIDAYKSKKPIDGKVRRL